MWNAIRASLIACNAFISCSSYILGNNDKENAILHPFIPHANMLDHHLIVAMTTSPHPPTIIVEHIADLLKIICCLLLQTAVLKDNPQNMMKTVGLE